MVLPYGDVWKARWAMDDPETTRRAERSAPTVTSAIGTEQVPEGVRSLTTLGEPDYVDLFTIKTPVAGDYSPEVWARAILEEIPLSRRHARRLWRSMGLRLGPAGSAEHIQGWRVTGLSEAWIRAEVSSWYLRAQALCITKEDEVSISLSLRYDVRPVATFVWAFVSRLHIAGVPAMLRQAVRMMEAKATTGS
jgi:hypothetical protein